MCSEYTDKYGSVWTEMLSCDFRPAEITDDEYDEFYKSFSKDSDKPFTRTHFTAEGEVGL